MSSSRPRRTVRAPSKLSGSSPAPEISTRPKRNVVPRGARDAPIPSKQKPKVEKTEKTEEEELDSLLKDPKSRLTEVDMSELINKETWGMLSREARERLVVLLPPTAFGGGMGIDETHPACASSSSSLRPSRNLESLSSLQYKPTEPSPSVDALDPRTFNDAHFLAAAHTFQDHIFSGWLTNTHAEKVRKYEEGVRDGTLSAEWKDEVWVRDNPERVPMDVGGPESGARAGEAAELKLTYLVKHNVLHIGDVIAYKRYFSTMDLVIEKDVIIDDINPKTHALTVLIPSRTQKSLPPDLLAAHSRALSSANISPTPGGVQSTEITSPTGLETAILDVDGRVERGKRPNGNAWKCFGVWRLQESDYGGNYMVVDGGPGGRGGRELQGTLFYLRGCFWGDR